MSPSICLGTAQLGMDYGITNTYGKTQIEEAKSIFRICSNNEIKYVDTAQSYGNSEEVIGKCIPKKHDFRLISKLTLNSQLKWDKDSVKGWEKSFQKTLINLKVNKIDSFLIHNPSELDNYKKEILIEWLNSLKERKFIKRIGISIYESNELDNLPLEAFQVIQVPLSIYDQRMLRDGTINKLAMNGFDIHVRSVFLQGLVLQSSDNWPQFLSSSFKSHHFKLTKYCDNNNLTLLDFALGFIKRFKQIEATVIGVNTGSHLKNILSSWSKDINNEIFHGIDTSWATQEDIDPRFWKNI